MPTQGVYLEEPIYSRLVRIAEGRAMTGAKLAAEILGRVLAHDARGRQLRRSLELEEP